MDPVIKREVESVAVSPPIPAAPNTSQVINELIETRL
jgi:hypothetical protein